MTDRLRGVGKIAAFVLVQVLVIAGLLWGLNQLQAGTDERELQQAEIVALQAGLTEANARLEAEGEPPVDVPDVEPGGDPQGPVVIQGERGHAGVRGIQGRTGPPGGIGPPGPVGEPGSDGLNGANGIDGNNGLNGFDGRGILSMQCASGGWIITYTDGIAGSDSGPCEGTQGPRGEPGADSTIPGPQGPQGTAKPGEYACPDGETMTGFTVAEDGAVTLSCQATTPPVIGPPIPEEG